MFTKIFVIAVVVLAISGENVMVDIARPRSSSSGAFEESIRKFWTEDKLKAAESLDVVLPNRLSKAVSKPTNTSTGPEIRIPGSLPSNNNTLLRIISSRGRQVYTTGRVFWRVGTASYTCSAAVVSSKTSDLIVTAGHCVYDTSARTWFINNNWVFVPAYSNGNAPYGVWTARRMLTSNAWVYSADYNYDIAFVAVSMYQQRHLQTVVGSQGIAFNQPRLAFTYSFGYPSNLDSGLYLKSCSGNTQKSRYTQGNYVGQGLPCNMGKGCSGGPWLQYVVDSTGIGYVTSVNSFMINNVPNVMNGPYFDSNIQTIYNQATSM